MARGDGLSIYFDERQLNLPAVRNPETGQFISIPARQLQRRNLELAEVLQADVVRRITDSITRGNASTGRLTKVTADERNRYATPYSMGVGVESWLDKSTARYWRTFEQGSAVTWRRGTMVGLQLRGLFASRVIGWRATRTPGPQPQPLAGGRWSRAGAGTAQGGKLRWFWSMPENPNFRVTKDVAGRLAYRRAAQNAHLDVKALQSARAYLDETFHWALSPNPH